VKVRLIRRQELVVCGYEVGTGGRSGQIGALVLGYYENGVLRYAGQVGSASPTPRCKELGALLKPLHQADSPIEETLQTAERHGVIWCAPSWW